MARAPSQNGPKIGPAFNSTTPTSVKRAQGDPGVLTQVTAIETRAARIKQRARDHFEKYLEVWVAKEAATIWKRRARLATDLPPLSEQSKEFVVNGLMAEARRNVHARMTVRLTKINGIRTRMNNTLVRNMQTLAPLQERGQRRSGGSPKKGSPSQ